MTRATLLQKASEQNMNVAHPEFNFFGFLVPWSSVAEVLGSLMAWPVVAALERVRLTRYLENLPLFFITLSIVRRFGLNATAYGILGRPFFFDS
jgi:hypothetical protein